MTPLGSNLTKGSSPASHHLGLLSERMFGLAWRLKTACGLASSVFYLAPRPLAGVLFRHAFIRVSRAAAAESRWLEGSYRGLKIQSISVIDSMTMSAPPLE
jgi:hypothetical protein